MRNPMMKKLAIVAALTAAILATGGACDDSNKSSDRERAVVDSTFDKLQASQPAHSMDYSPTRATKNFWIDTWGRTPGKLSYVYLQAADGHMTGYYILVGLPVSYCTSLVPTFDVHDFSGGGGVVTPRQSMDGTWSTGSGGCSTYYGRDATTGAYIEYTVGLGNNVLLFDQPLPPQKAAGAIALGPTRVEDVPR